jgi:hypothetical protein
VAYPTSGGKRNGAGEAAVGAVVTEGVVDFQGRKKGGEGEPPSPTRPYRRGNTRWNSESRAKGDTGISMKT